MANTLSECYKDSIIHFVISSERDGLGQREADVELLEMVGCHHLENITRVQIWSRAFKGTWIGCNYSHTFILSLNLLC